MPEERALISYSAILEYAVSQYDGVLPVQSLVGTGRWLRVLDGRRIEDPQEFALRSRRIHSWLNTRRVVYCDSPSPHLNLMPKRGEEVFVWENALTEVRRWPEVVAANQVGVHALIVIFVPVAIIDEGSMGMTTELTLHLIWEDDYMDCEVLEGTHPHIDNESICWGSVGDVIYALSTVPYPLPLLRIASRWRLGYDPTSLYVDDWAEEGAAWLEVCPPTSKIQRSDTGEVTTIAALRTAMFGALRR